MAARGGKREGAGRPKLNGRLIKSIVLTNAHFEAVTSWAAARGLPTLSAAMRELIEMVCFGE